MESFNEIVRSDLLSLPVELLKEIILRKLPLRAILALNNTNRFLRKLSHPFLMDWPLYPMEEQQVVLHAYQSGDLRQAQWLICKLGFGEGDLARRCEIAAEAADRGDLALLQWLARNTKTARTILEAIVPSISCHLSILLWAWEIQWAWNNSRDRFMKFRGAIRKANLLALEVLFIAEEREAKNKADLDDLVLRTVLYAARHGKPEVIDFMKGYRHFQASYSMFFQAALGGKQIVSMERYKLDETGSLMRLKETDIWSCIEIFEFAARNNYPNLRPIDFHIGIRSGSVDTVRAAVEHFGPDLSWLREQLPTLIKDHLPTANNLNQMIDYLYSLSLISDDQWREHLESRASAYLFAWAAERGLIPPRRILGVFVEPRHQPEERLRKEWDPKRMKLIRSTSELRLYICEMKLPCHPAEKSNVVCNVLDSKDWKLLIEILTEHGYPLPSNERIATFPLLVIRCIHARKALTLNERWMEALAVQGRIKALQWSRSNGAEWNERVTEIAWERKDWDTLYWLVNNGCPCASVKRHAAADPNVIKRCSIFLRILLTTEWE